MPTFNDILGDVHRDEYPLGSIWRITSPGPNQGAIVMRMDDRMAIIHPAVGDRAAPRGDCWSTVTNDVHCEPVIMEMETARAEVPPDSFLEWRGDVMQRRGTSRSIFNTPSLWSREYERLFNTPATQAMSTARPPSPTAREMMAQMRAASEALDRAAIQPPILPISRQAWDRITVDEVVNHPMFLVHDTPGEAVQVTPPPAWPFAPAPEPAPEEENPPAGPDIEF